LRTTLGKLPWYWVILCLIAGVAIGFWHPGEHSGTASLEGRLLDLRHLVRGPIEPPAEYVIVAIDDKTLRRLKRFPPPRAAIAACIDRLTEAGAKVVAVDLLLDGDTLPTDDAALSRAVERNGHVILATALTTDVAFAVPNGDEELISRNVFSIVESDAQNVGIPVSRGILLPIPALAQSVDLAHVNVPRDADNAVRRIALALPLDDFGYLPAMALEVARALRGLPRSDMRLQVGVAVQFGAHDIPTDVGGQIALNHYGPQGTFQTYSLIDVVDGLVSPNAFKDRAVFVGSTALGFGDTFVSPFGAQLPGVEAHATAAANISHGQFIRRNLTTWVIDIVAAALLSILAFVTVNFRSLSASAVMTAILWLGIALFTQLAFSHAFLWLDATTYVLVLASIGLATFSARIVQQRRISGQIQHERDNLARYQSPLLTELLAAQQSPSFNERAQEAAVMFVDVAAFTRRAEHLGPSATVEFLRDLHGRIERSALANRGVIEQFMGDGAMIIFGLPEPKPDDAARALAATRQLLETLGDWNLDLEAAGQEPVHLRVGLHYGPVIAALLGGERQGQITVAGDTVNVASRLQEMGKEHKVAIVASAEFVASVHRAGRDDMLTGMRRLAGQKVRGRDETIDLWVWP
jgi:adenylate cyclase